MDVPVYVLDASVGVKWFRSEQGSIEAIQLLASHVRGELVLAVDWLFMYEVLGVLARHRHPRGIEQAWDDLVAWELNVVALEADLVAAAVAQREVLSCSLYDAFSAGLASQLRAPLVSADARAHGAYPQVRLLGD